MPQVRFAKMMADAEAGGYAVGYFESWNLESLFAVADAAIEMRAPVILGLSGIHFPLAESEKRERLGVWSKLGAALCNSLPVPACLLFNESPRFDWVLEAIQNGFDLVMYTDDSLPSDDQKQRVRQVVDNAHAKSVAVEGEITALPGLSGALSAIPQDLRLTDPEAARAFVQYTGVDALAVNAGQVHVHGRTSVPLNLSLLRQLRQAVPVPLVLHGATSISEEDLAAAIQLGVRKINVGSALKRVYFEALRDSCGQVGEPYNPYDVVGSGVQSDVAVRARRAVTAKIQDYMRIFGSAGKGKAAGCD
jgi:fructose/tagatose bisphosphate aldolase